MTRDDVAKEKPKQKDVFIDPNRFPEPELIGFANRFWFWERDTSIEVGFFEDRGNFPPVLLLRSHCALDDMLMHVWASAKDVAKLLAERFPNPPEYFWVAESPFVGAVPPSVAFNYTRIARQGLDAAIDLFYLTPRSIHLAVQNREKAPEIIQALPVGTVQMPLPMLCRFLNELEQRKERWIDELRGVSDYKGFDWSVL
jgi:hypothetical protein